jgi:DNA-binding winged helix-turn-helix (wHTH) protein/tetratricopeptide (TPR) repeat protein
MNAAAPFPVPPATDGYQLADLHVDVRTRRVLRHGTDLEVTRLSFDLLLSLVRASPGLVTFDALMKQVWPGVVVSPETLTQRVKLLRQSLGDNADHPRYILAVRGHGYRLLVAAAPLLAAPKTAVAEPVAVPSRRWRFAGPAVLLLIGGVAAAWWVLAPGRNDSPAARTEEAYQFFLQAESVVNGTPQSFLAAIALYDAALARDPGLAHAYSGRAMNRAALVWNGSQLARGLDDAQADAEKALRLDSADPVAHAAMASINALRGEWSASQKSFRAAIAANPSDAGALGRYAVTLLLSTGQLREARREAAEAQRLAPDEGFAAAVGAFVDHALGADEEAVELADFAVSRGADPRQLVHVHASAAERRGNYAEAAEHAIRMLPPAVLDVGGAATIRQAYAAREDPTQRPVALGALRKLTSQPAWERADPNSRQAVIYLQASLGAIDELYHEMNLMLRRDGATYPEILAIGMMWAPEMRPFRQDRRFQDLAQRLGLMDYWKQAGPPDACTLSDSQLVCR